MLDNAIEAALKADRWDEAIAKAEELVALRSRVQGPKHDETATDEWRLKALRRVASMSREDRIAYQSAITMNERAETLINRGKYAEAQLPCAKALKIRQRLFTDDSPCTAESYCNLATTLSAQGKYFEAHALHEKALKINRRLFGGDHTQIAVICNNLATNLDAWGRFFQAQPYYQEALRISQSILGDDSILTATCYSNLAANLNAQKKYAEAQVLFEKALTIRRRLLTDDHPETAAIYNNLAYNLSAQGRYAQAQPLYERALQIRRRLLTDDHPDIAANYNNLAYNLNAQGRYAEARDRWLVVVKSLDAARLQLAFDGLERAGKVKSPRAALAAVQARLGQPAEAWQALEKDLGRGLLDELAARQDRRLGPAERDHLRELTTDLERLDRLVETAPKGLDQAERAKRFEELRRQCELASIALGEFQANLARDHGTVEGQVAGLDEIQAALPADTALVAWVDIPPVGPNAADPDGEHWGVVVRSRGVPSWIPIAGTGPDGLWSHDDSGLTSRVRTELRRRPDRGTGDLLPLIERLRIQRLEPLAMALGATADGLPTARRLIVLPSRLMAGIPVEALLASDDTRTVSYAPSATVFKYLREQPRPDRHAGLLALGDPIYASARSRDEGFDPLPSSRDEVRAIAQLFQSAGRPAHIFLGSDASEPVLDRLAVSGELGRFGVIHLATHVVIDEDVPARSAVILTQVGLLDPLDQALKNELVFDGRLSVREIQRGWELNAELVTLSACETALGRDADGEGYVGFAQAFFLAGTRSMLVSLWEVDDRATSLLMTRFYQNWLGKRPGLDKPLAKAEALREAKQWLRESTDKEVKFALPQISRGEIQSNRSQPKTAHPYAHPHYWAGFILVGDPD